MEALGKDTARHMIKLATKAGAVPRPWSDAPKDQLDEHGYLDEVHAKVHMAQRMTMKFDISGKKPGVGIRAAQQENAALTKAAELNAITAQGEEVPRLIAEEGELQLQSLGAPPASAPSTWEQKLHQLSRRIAQLTEDGSAHLLVGTPHGGFSALREEIVATAQPVGVTREPRTEQDIGLKHPADFQVSAPDNTSVEENLPRLRQKTAECEVLKQETMKAFITRVQDELLAWFRTCCITEREAPLEEGWESQDWQGAAMKESSAVRVLQTLKDFSWTTGSAPGKAALPRASAPVDRAADPTRLIRGEIERLGTPLPTKEAAA